MSGKVRAKFQVTTKDLGETGNVYFLPANTGSEEKKTSWEAKPAGSIQLFITNPEAFKRFEPGKEYYISFTPAHNNAPRRER
ncbi:MAG: hypothetical protein JWN30_1137 [Bacilli bacterium]|nr:hypothetical protein [Bacilli bacterium]